MLSIPMDRGIDPRTRHPAAFMASKWLITAATLLGFGLNLASCGSFVADHWPHWAGGLPADVPPRPGTPGYEEFVAHGQSRADAKPDAKQEPTATAAAVQSGAPQAPLAPAPAAPVSPAPPAGAAAPAADVQDSSVVNGGLY
jgi:hypothetical protein